MSSVSCDDLTPLKKGEFCLEGTLATLSYNYSRTATGGDKVYWYHQDTAQRPEFLLYTSGSEFIKKAYPLNTAKLNEEKKHLDLEISSTESGHVTALEGGLVTLSCNYTSSSTSPDLFWYIQLTRDSPQYVLRRDCYSEGSNSDEFKKRFDSRLNFTSSSVPLTIQRLQPSDSPLYYCALRSTVTTEDSVTAQKIRVECCSDNLFTFAGDTYEQSIEPNQHEVYGEEGRNVQLSCNHSSAYSVLWYKQYPGSAPQFLLFICHASRTVVRAKPPYPHLTVKLNKKKTCADREISSAEVRYSALYNYAVMPTGTHNSLIQHSAEYRPVT
ncbi:unnamed protein product, partial [Coregonus sp. 'balchen']